MFLRRLLCFWITISFVSTLIIPPQKVFAQAVLGLPEPGTMVNLSQTYTPLLIKGLKVHPDNPLLFDFIMDTGNDPRFVIPVASNVIPAKAGIQNQEQLKAEAQKLIKYFLATLTIPEKDLWVNLSPYEKERMVPNELGQTELGRDMLAQDYVLKQLTASLIYPERHLGKEFWDRVYAKAQRLYGTTQIPVNTFNKVWILADKAHVYVHDNTAFVVAAHLKVMLDEDYLALEKNSPTRGHVPLTEGKGYVSPSTLPSDSALNLKASQGNPQPTNTLASNIVRQIILPEIEKEVNDGKNFSSLRQIFYSMILATWYKKNLKQALLTQVYADKKKITNLSFANNKNMSSQNNRDMSSPNVLVGDPQYIYQQYLKAYKKGVFNYIKEDVDQTKQQTIPRKYFSGGEVMDLTNAEREVTAANPEVPIFATQGFNGEMLDVRSSFSAAMSAKSSDSALTATFAVKARLIDTFRDHLDELRQGQLNALLQQLGDGWTFVRSDLGVEASNEALTPFIDGDSIIDSDTGWLIDTPDQAKKYLQGQSIVYTIQKQGSPKIFVIVPDAAMTTIIISRSSLKKLGLSDFLISLLPPGTNNVGKLTQMAASQLLSLRDLKTARLNEIRALLKLNDYYLKGQELRNEDGTVSLLSPVELTVNHRWEADLLRRGGLTKVGDLAGIRPGTLLNMGIKRETVQKIEDNLEINGAYLSSDRFLHQQLENEIATFVPSRQGWGDGIATRSIEGKAVTLKMVIPRDEGDFVDLVVHRPGFEDAEITGINKKSAVLFIYNGFIVVQEGDKKRFFVIQTSTQRQNSLVAVQVSGGLLLKAVGDNLRLLTVHSNGVVFVAESFRIEPDAKRLLRLEAKLHNGYFDMVVDMRRAVRFFQNNQIDRAMANSTPDKVLNILVKRHSFIWVAVENSKVAMDRKAKGIVQAFVDDLSPDDVRKAAHARVTQDELDQIKQRITFTAKTPGGRKSIYGQVYYVISWHLADKALTANVPAKGRGPVNDLGGIDLNSRHMQMDVSGGKIDIHFDPAMVAQFKRGDFSGVRAMITSITTIPSIIPLLGLKPDEE